MIRRIKTSVNGVLGNNEDNSKSLNSNSMSYNNDARNSSVEELDLSTYSNEKNHISNNVNVTKDTVLNAIEKNFENNRKITNEMNNQVYNVLRDKITQYMTNNGSGV